MKLRIAARRSELARYQAFLVGEAIEKSNSRVTIEYLFTESSGDLDLTSPLWKMPDKGVFTKDLSKLLADGGTDLVVHSMKDLPVEESDHHIILPALKRADPRDIIFYKPDVRTKKPASLRILSSSPRRAHNIPKCLNKLLPFEVKVISFDVLRGNLRTRLKKFLEDPNADAIVFAKAGIDRLFGASNRNEFPDLLPFCEELLKLPFQVLPIVENPTAASQGILAIELRRNDLDTRALVQPLIDGDASFMAERERKELVAFGGGCHLKLGISVVSFGSGYQMTVRGEDPNGDEIQKSLVLHPSGREISLPSNGKYFPSPQLTASGQRTELSCDFKILQEAHLFVARAQGLPMSYTQKADQLIWVSGPQSWRKLASRGFWVSGCSESLGDQSQFFDPESPLLSRVFGPTDKLPRKKVWLKLTHDATTQENPPGFQSKMRVYPTYRLAWDVPDLYDVDTFFWSSASLFSAAFAKDSTLASRGTHYCGPGITFEKLSRIIQPERLRMYPSLELWQKQVGKSDTEGKQNSEGVDQ